MLTVHTIVPTIDDSTCENVTGCEKSAFGGVSKICKGARDSEMLCEWSSTKMKELRIRDLRGVVQTTT